MGKTFQSNAYASPPAVVDPTRWRAATDVVHKASRVYRDAASSSGMFTTQQIRATSETEKFTKALQKQQLSFGDMKKHWGIMKNVYNDQLRMQRMVAQGWGSDLAGRQVTDIAIPKNVPRDLDTMRRKMGMFGNMAASAGTQVVNLGKNIQWSGRQLTVGFTYPMVLFGAAAGAMAYKVENSFAQINKVYDFSAKAINNQSQMEQEQNDLRIASMKTATEVAKQYGMTVEKTLGIEQELAATGQSGTQLQSSTKQVARISTLGDIDPEQTTAMVVALQTAFKKTIKDGDDLNDTLNFMNAASNATSLSLQDIAQATPRAATGIAQLGGTAKEMTILLVSMREAGVDAASGANALKSATTRIINPVKKATDFYDKYNISLEKLAKESGGNLFKYLKLLGVEQQKINGKNEKQTALLRAQGVAALFGTYQNNRLTASLVNMGDAYAGLSGKAGTALNQTAKAMQLQEKTPEQLQKIADASKKAMIDNPAGRLRQEWAALQITLSEVGKPFLDAATRILAAAGKIAEFFNKMPDWQKKFIGISAVAVGLAGPVVMLAGLFLNLSGQFIKGVGAAAKFLGISTLVTKEEQAAALATDLQNKALLRQTETTMTLTQEIGILTAAMRQANEVSMQLAELETGVAGAAAEGAAVAADAVVAGEAEKQAAIKRTIEMQQAEVEAAIAASTAAAKRGIYGQYVAPTITAPTVVAPTIPARGNNVRAIQEQQILQKRANDMAALEQRSLDTQATSLNRNNLLRQEGVNRTNAQLAIQNKVKNSITGGGIAMGVMGASMAAMMINSKTFHSETVNTVAEWAMIGTIAAPALKSMVGTGSKFATGMTAAVSSIRNAQAGAVGLTGAMGVARAGAVGFGAAINEALGPIGWIALGLTAVAGVFMAIRSHNKKMQEEQDALIKKQHDANVAMENSAANIAQAMGKTAGYYQQITNNSGALSGTSGFGPSSTTMKSFNYYKTDEEGKKALDSIDLKNTETTLDKVNTQFIDLQVVGKLTAKQAADSLKGMLLAAGMSYKDATAMVENVYKRIGDISKVDWTKPIKDQITALQNSVGNKPLFQAEILSTGSGFANIVSDEDKGQVAALQDQADRSAQIFNQALQSAASPQDAKKIIDQYMKGALSQWDTGFEGLEAATASGSDKIKALFTKYGVTDGATFAKAFNSNDDFKKAYEAMYNDMDMNAPLARQMEAAAKSGSLFESTVMKPLVGSSVYLAGALDNVNSAMSLFKENSVGLTADEATNNLLTQNKAYKEYAAALAQVNELKRARVPDDSVEMITAQNRLNKAAKVTVKQINEVNKAFGFAPGRTATEALNNLLNHTKASADDAANSVDNINNKLAQMPSRKTVTIKMDQVGGIMQDAMSSVQDQMAQGAQDKFNAGWDSRMAGVQASQERASNALENAQQRASDAFDKRWEHRKDVVNKAYDARIKAIQNEIEREQDADDTRQRIFEKEKARLQQLADMQNTNIDFNTALNEGKLDEAAKTLNNAQAANGNAEMDAEQKAAEARSAAKVKALEKKNDRLEKQRDKEIKQLEKMEDRMKKHLERIQKARSDALAAQNTDVMNSLQAQKDMEEATLNARLDLFKAYTATNKKDLEKWMKELGFTYDDFGTDITHKGEAWSKSIQTSLNDAIRQAGTEVMNDNIWEKAGKEVAEKMVKGMGFKDMADFRSFVKTGEKGQGSAPAKGGGANTGTDHKAQTRHGGGIIGSGPQSTGRGGIPNTFRGLHRSEQMVRAQKGEYMVNRKEAKANLPLLKMINAGQMPSEGLGGLPAPDVMSYGVPSFGGPGALMAGVVANMFGRGVEKSINNNYALGKSRTPKYTSGKNPGSLEQVNIPFGSDATATGQSAIAWALGQIGVMGWYHQCLSFVRQALGAPGGVYDAKTSWYGTNHKYSAANPSNVPAGVPVFWTNGDNGHVALSTGNGGAISTDHPTFNTAGRTSISSLNSWLGQPAAGWSSDINGKQVYPALKTGGKTKGEGLAYLHNEEAVLTKPLTKDLEDTVSTFGETARKNKNKPLFTEEGPRYYKAAYQHNHKFAIDGPKSWDWPFQTTLSEVASKAFEKWLSKMNVPFDPSAKIVDYDMRGFFKKTKGRGWHEGSHFPDTFKTPYDTTFSHESKYATKDNPFYWKGERLVDRRNGQVVFAEPMPSLRVGGTLRADTMIRAHRGETVLTAPLTESFKQNVSNGSGDTFHVTLDLRGATIEKEVDIEKAVNRAIDERETRRGRKRVVR